MEQQPPLTLNVTCDSANGYKLYLDTKQPNELIQSLKKVVSALSRDPGAPSFFRKETPFTIHISNSSSLGVSDSDTFESEKVSELLRQLQEALHSSVRIERDGAQYRVLLENYDLPSDTTAASTKDTLIASGDTREEKRQPPKKSEPRPLTDEERQRTTGLRASTSRDAASDMLSKYFKRA